MVVTRRDTIFMEKAHHPSSTNPLQQKIFKKKAVPFLWRPEASPIFLPPLDWCDSFGDEIYPMEPVERQNDTCPWKAPKGALRRIF